MAKKTTKTLKKTGLKARPKKIVKKEIIEEDLEPIKTDGKKLDDKYLRVKETETREHFKLIGERVQLGELQWAYYTIENNFGVHYYIIKNKN